MYRLTACLLLPYFALVSLNTADVVVDVERVSDAGISSMSVLECIEHCGMDLDTDTRDGGEQDTASKTQKIGDTIVNNDSGVLLPEQLHHIVPPCNRGSHLQPIIAPAVPPPDRAPHT